MKDFSTREEGEGNDCGGGIQKVVTNFQEVNSGDRGPTPCADNDQSTKSSAHEDDTGRQVHAGRACAVTGC